MSPRTLTVGLAAVVATAFVPAAAQAGFMAEMKAAGKVERKVNRMHPGYNPTAFCDQIGSRKFWCTYMATRGDCIVNGKARVAGGRVRIVADDRTCL